MYQTRPFCTCLFCVRERQLRVRLEVRGELLIRIVNHRVDDREIASDGDEDTYGAIGGAQRPSEVISGHQLPLTAIRGHQRSSAAHS